MRVTNIECLVNGLGCLIETDEGIEVRVFDKDKEAYTVASQYVRGLINMLEFKMKINLIMAESTTKFDVAFVK